MTSPVNIYFIKITFNYNKLNMILNFQIKPHPHVRGGKRLLEWANQELFTIPQSIQEVKILTILK